MEHTLALIRRAHQGDKRARDAVFEENTGLVYSVAKRFLGRGVEMEDLVQIGCIGLLKAVDKFEPAFEVRFSTYAVPMIAGEIKRFLRDNGMIKVSRSLKELAWKACALREKLEKELGESPPLALLAQKLGVEMEELVQALDSGAEVESLQKTICQGSQGDVSLEDRLVEKSSQQEGILNRILLEETLKHLDARERQMIYLRYFEDKTQTEIAKKLGISQVQVSRMEKRVLKTLKKRIEGSVL